MHRRFATTVLLLLSAGCATRHVDTSQSSTTSQPPEINLLSMGDWGRGSPLQKTVSTSMSQYVTSVNKPFSGCLLAGDNFYVPLASTADPNWKKVFEDMYDSKTLNFPFYVSLGNHDHQNPKEIPAKKNEIELAYAQEHPESRWKFPALWYRVDLPN